MSVNTFGYTILDTNVKTLTSFNTIEAQGSIVLNAFDNTQPNGLAAGNAGKNAFIAIGNNSSNNPLYIVGQDTQPTAGQPNRGKCSIVPNVGVANHQYDGHETMGIGYDTTTKTTPMPAGAWIRSAVDAAPFVGFNACFSLSNVDNTQTGTGVYYTHELTRVGQPNANDYNLYLNNSPPTASQNILNIHPLTPTTTAFTITATNINLNGIVSFNNNAAVGTATIPNAGASILVDVSVGGAGLNGVSATSIIMVTQASANAGPNTAIPLYVIAGVNQFSINTIAVTGADVKVNWNIVKY